ncbi:unnamed protein product [Rotaria sordida]|uniref:Uncharacterized protein n=1 Tax=Rotaria sordida TaxID=392033 RepID=A0A814GH31_9BILA|nr:unnamed protein product [Rotaria sordida]CAF0995518.1 unnamed protein product [Rotaria sordida]CAF0996237.1 unnamed protein product [Rotaria sordida]
MNINSDECEFLNMCKCTNFPLFTLIDTSYLSKPRSLLNQDLFCTYSSEYINETKLTTFDQFKYFYYRFRTLTFANYPYIPTKAFRFIHFESQTVKKTHKINNRNVIAFVNIKQTQSGIFEELSLSDSQEQLIISFLNSPLLIYTNGALSKLNCYELKLHNTNPKIPIDFFYNTHFIHHLIIDNPSFTGFLPSSNTFTFQVYELSIKDISVRHLQGKHFPIIFNSVKELKLENYYVNGGFQSFNNRELAQRFPQLRTLKIFSRSIQHITKRMFQHLNQLEYLILDGITTIENEAFFNLYNLKELNLGRNILRLDRYAFLYMNTNLLLLNESIDFQLNDEKHFCVFAQFSPSTNLKTFIKFPKNLYTCSCTIRYLYRHIDKSFMSMTPNCYSNSSLYILAQEERLCYFEQRLLQCHVLPDEGITIYGKHYNVSYFYQQQIAKQRNKFTIFYRYRIYFLILLPVLIISICLTLFIIRQKKRYNASTYRHLNRLIKRQRLTRSDDVTMDIIYHRTNGHQDLRSSTIPISTKV